MGCDLFTYTILIVLGIDDFIQYLVTIAKGSTKVYASHCKNKQRILPGCNQSKLNRMLFQIALI